MRAKGFAPEFLRGVSPVGADGKPAGPLRVVLSKGGTVSGRVAFAGRSTPAGVRLRLYGAFGARDATADAQGDFRFEHVAAGKHVLATCLGQPTSALLAEKARADLLARAGAVEVDLQDGEAAAFAVTVPALPWVEGAIEGSIDGAPAGTSLAGHRVLVAPADVAKGAPFVHTATTGADGTFTVRDLLPGDYEVTVFAGGSSVEASVTIPTGAGPVRVRLAFGK